MSVKIRVNAVCDIVPPARRESWLLGQIEQAEDFLAALRGRLQSERGRTLRRIETGKADTVAFVSVPSVPAEVALDAMGEGLAALRDLNRQAAGAIADISLDDGHRIEGMSGEQLIQAGLAR